MTIKKPSYFLNKQSYHTYVPGVVLSTLHKYSQPSISMGSISLDSTNCGSKIFRKKFFFESSKNQSLNLPHVSIHRIYIVLGITDNLKMIYSIQEDMCSLYANTMPYHIRPLASTESIWERGPGTNPSRIPSYSCINSFKPQQPNQSCRYYCYFHFIDGKTKAQRSQELVTDKVGIQTQLFGSWICAFNPYIMLPLHEAIWRIPVFIQKAMLNTQLILEKRGG